MGMLIRAQTLWYGHAPNAMVMEAYTLRDGKVLPMEQGYQKVSTETDAQDLVKL